MLVYLVRRLLLAIPTLLIISLLTFALSRYVAVDPVQVDYRQMPAAYLAKVRDLGLDKPYFYLSLTSLAFPDTLHRVLPLDDRDQLVAWTGQTGNWAASFRFYTSVTTGVQPALDAVSGQVFTRLAGLQLVRELDRVPAMLKKIRSEADTLSDPGQKAVVQTALDDVQSSYEALEHSRQRWKLLVPVLRWNGLDNQYHHWLSGFVTGDPGRSIVTGNSLLVELRPRLLITLLLNGMAILLAFLAGVPLGVWMARYYRRPADKWMRSGLMFVYAMPVMWMGSLLIMLFARPDTGLGLIDGLNAEPWLMSGKPFGRWVWDNLEKFVLPVLTLTLHTLAILAIQMRGGVLEVIKQDYIRTARAKGLSENRVYWRHAFRNALFPVISVFAAIFPAIFSGSLVIEYLFDFPGMGIKMEAAFANNDYAVLFAMVMFVSVVTIIGTLLADVLYAWADPRVRFDKR